MSDTTIPRFRPVTDEAPLTRWILIALAAGGLGILVLAPLLVVFAQALSKGC
jgi:sulfate/thiosulfate transport system permease protein